MAGFRDDSRTSAFVASPDGNEGILGEIPPCQLPVLVAANSRRSRAAQPQIRR